MATHQQKYEPSSFAALAGTELGENLWQFLLQETIVSRLETATDLGSPAVAGIEGPLLEEFSEKVLNDRVKQMIGHMVRQIMEAKQYEVEKQNVTIRSALFSKGTRYCKSGSKRLQVFRNSKNNRQLCFAATRKTENLPPNEDGSKWIFWASFAGKLRGTIVYGIDVDEIHKKVAAEGFALHYMNHILRPS